MAAHGLCAGGRCMVAGLAQYGGRLTLQVCACAGLVVVVVCVGGGGGGAVCVCVGTGTPLPEGALATTH